MPLLLSVTNGYTSRQETHSLRDTRNTLSDTESVDTHTHMHTLAHTQRHMYALTHTIEGKREIHKASTH